MVLPLVLPEEVQSWDGCAIWCVLPRYQMELAPKQKEMFDEVGELLLAPAHLG